VDVNAELLTQPAVVFLRLLVLGLKDGQRLDEGAPGVAIDVEVALLVLLAAAAVARIVASRGHAISVRGGGDRYRGFARLGAGVKVGEPSGCGGSLTS
jgi:hypothetical protein